MTQEEHDLLVNLAQDVSELKQDIKEMDNRLTGVEGQIEGLKQDMKEMDNRLTGQIEGLKQDMKEMDNRLTSELERQRKNMVVMEFNLSEKIDALFVEREINKDNFKDNKKKFKSIDNILEQHAYRISALESKVN